MKGKICSWKMKAVAWILAVVMVFSIMPSTVYAAAQARVVSEEEGLVLDTTLTENLTVKGRRKLFDVWARDLSGNTVHPAATFDGEDLTPSWDDNVKTSFTLDFEGKDEGEHQVVISMVCDDGTKELTYTVNYVKAEEGEFIGYATVCIEAFTISQGYIIEPVLMPIYEGDNAAKAFVELIQESGYDLTYTGTIESGFYMSSMLGSNAERSTTATKELPLENVALEPNMLEKAPQLADNFDPDMGSVGALGEFDYGYMTGWMYCVNTVFPNVGAADYYLSGGDVMRWQFTVAYGGEIGGSSALGGGWDDYYTVANKDALTTTLAYINSAPNSEELKNNAEIAAAIERAKEVLQNIPVGQEEVEAANNALRELLNGTVTGITLNQTEMTLANGESVVLTPSITYTGNPSEPVEWSSSNLDAVTVKNGTVTAVGEGIATITATCGGQSATCQVTVPAAPLAGITLNKTEASIAKGTTLSLTASPVPANTTDKWSVTWSSENEEAATVNAGGRVTGVAQGTAVITAAAGDYSASCTVTVMEYPMTGVKLNYYTGSVKKGSTFSIIPSYLPSNTTDTKGGTWTSSDTSVATVTGTSSGMVRGVAEGTAVITFTSKTGGFQASCLVQVISGTKKTATSITLDKMSVTLLAPGADTAELTATLSTGATDPVLWESSDTKVVTVEDGVLHAVAPGEAVVTAYAGSKSAACAVTVEPSANLSVQVTPADAIAVLKDASGNEVSAVSGTYTLLAGEDYTLKVTKNGYIGTSKTINISADTVENITLKAAAASTLKNLPAAWKNFRNSDVNMGITSAKTPKSTATTYQKWAEQVGNGWGSAAAGSPILVDDAIIIMQGSTLRKYDKETGELIKSVPMAGAQDYGYTPPTYAEGMIFVPIHGMIQAFNAETLESLWVYTDELGGQALSPITYADGYVYTGFWNSETKDANYVCVSVTDEDPEQEQEAKLSTWEYTSAGGFYWAGALVRGDSVIFGTDDGNSGSTGASSMLSLNRYTGKVQDSLEITGDQRSTVSYEEKTGRIWFTTKGGYLYSAVLKEDGTFEQDSLRSLQVGGASTSTPLVYKDRVYVGVTSGSNFSGKFGVNVIDANAMSVIYSAELQGYPQCSVLLSNAYEEEDGTVYIYATYNSKPGGISLIRDKQGQTTADIEEIFVPDAEEYCISSIICDGEGTLYYKNDSGKLFAVSSSDAYLTGASVEVEGAVIDGGEAFAGEKAAHEITVPVSAESITLNLTASEGSVVSVDGVEGTSFRIPMSDEAAAVTVKVTKGKDERTYTFMVRKQSQDASLADLKVGTSNAYSSFLTLAPAFDNTVYEYRAEHTSAISFMRLWVKATDANAAVKVYPMSEMGNTRVSEDGTIPVTGTNGTNQYRAIYFKSGYDCSKVRIEVTAEDGETTKNFYVSMKQNANNAPVITAAEDAAVHTDNETGRLTFTSNEYGKAYYQFAAEGEAAPASIDTTGEGIDVEIGENTIDLTGLQKQGGMVYLVVKDADASPHTSNMLAVSLAAYAGPEDAVIEQINAIPVDEDGMPDAESVKKVRAAYDALSDVQKSRVTNYAKLAEAERKLAEEENRTNLTQAKADAAAELDAYKNEADYSQENLTALREAADAAREKIAEAGSYDGIRGALRDGKAAMDEIPTLSGAVSAQIAALGEITLESSEAVEAARAAYDALPGDVKGLVENYSELVSAEKELEILRAEAESRSKDEAAAASIRNAIDAIGEVSSLDKRGEVAAVRAVYESLSEAQKALVTNLETLNAAEAEIARLTAAAEEQARKDREEQERQEALAEQAAPVIAAIEGLGTVSLDSEADIRAAREAYEALSEEAQAKVENYAELVIAEKELAVLKAEEESRSKDEAAAASVRNAIDAIGEVDSLDKKGEVAAVRAVYESLSEVQKALVTNLETLNAAEAEIARLTAEVEEQAKAAQEEQERQNALAEQALPVVTAIKAIGTVSLDSEADIRAARAAYEALSEEAQAKVENYAELVIAEKELAVLKAEEESRKKEEAAAAQIAKLTAAAEEQVKKDAEEQTKQNIQEGQVYTVGNYFYKVTSTADMTVAVTGLQNDSLKKLAIPNTVTLGNKAYKVTSIAASAFKNNKKITSVVIKKNLEAIGANAFAGCGKLKKVTINSTKLGQIGSKAFYNCGKLTNITIKSKVLKKVGKNAFKGTAAKLTVKVPAAKYKAYTKLLAKKGQSKTAKIKK